MAMTMVMMICDGDGVGGVDLICDGDGDGDHRRSNEDKRSAICDGGENMDSYDLSQNEVEAIQLIQMLICESKTRGYDISQLQTEIGGENADAVGEDRVFSRFRMRVRSCIWSVSWKKVHESGRRVVFKMSEAILKDALPDDSGGVTLSLREFLLGIILG